MEKSFGIEICKAGFPLEGQYLVEASAGTGKTYNIQNIYGRLVMEKGLRTSEIVVMTFTEAATKELKSRIRAVLKDLLARFSGKDCESAQLDEEKRREEIRQKNARGDALIQCVSPGEFGRAKRSVELALLEFDNASISTIHGFCSRALSRYAFETRMGFHPEIQDDKVAVLNRMVLDWWRSRRNEAPESIRDALELDTLRSYTQALGAKTDWVLEFPEGEESPKGYLLARAGEIVAEYEGARSDRETQTYDDILRAMREALDGPYGEIFGRGLRSEYKAALVDEFQDTDPVQYEIFRKAFLAEGGLPVFFVGDPKQAIYFFRGGDIFTYRQAKATIAEDRRFRLDTNHRSTPRLMAAVNALFRDRTGADGARHYTFEDEQIPYDDVGAADKPGVLVPGPDGVPQEDPAPFKVIEVAGDLHVALTAEILRTLEEPLAKLTPGNLAILVNSHSEAAAIQACLRSQGVPCVLQKPGNVFGKKSLEYNAPVRPSRMALSFQQLFSAVLGYGDRRAVFTALSSPFFGLTPGEILSLQSDDLLLAEWFAHFRDLEALWQKRGLGAMLAEVERLGTRGGAGLRQRLSRMPEGERLLADYEQIQELCFATTKSRGNTPSVLSKWLEERLCHLEDEDDTEEYARELESESDSVHVMTMHAAKGLEFPVVFLPNCSATPMNDALPAYHADGAVLTFTTDSANPQALREKLQEHTRLLYVAMTRATKRTVVLYKTSARNAAPTLPMLLENARANGAGPENAGSPIQWRSVDTAELAEIPRYVSNQGPCVLGRPSAMAPRFDCAPTKGSYSAMTPSLEESSFVQEEKDWDAGDRRQEFPENGVISDIFRIRGGTAIGSCWHDILEKISFQALEEEIRGQSARSLEEAGFDPLAELVEGNHRTFLDVTGEMICRTLDYPICTPEGAPFCLREVSWRDRLSEQEFNFASWRAAENTVALAEILRSPAHWGTDPSKAVFLQALQGWEKGIPHGFVNGFMDLVFRHEGRYYIVDWKSNSLKGRAEEFTRDGVAREMARHGYFFQYLLYAAVLHQYLKETLPGYSWERHFGGIRYYFLRGIAAGGKEPVFSDRPSEELLEELGGALGLHQSGESIG